MAWLDVEWANGDTPTAAKGNQMQDNLDYVREALRGQIVAQEATNLEAASMSTANWAVRVNIGALEWTSSSITGTSFAELAGLKNQDISTLTNGVAYLLTVTAEGNSATALLLSSTYVAHADGDFLSIFGEVRKGATDLASLRGYTAIVTRDDEGF